MKTTTSNYDKSNEARQQTMIDESFGALDSGSTRFYPVRAWAPLRTPAESAQGSDSDDEEFAIRTE